MKKMLFSTAFIGLISSSLWANSSEMSTEAYLQTAWSKYCDTALSSEAQQTIEAIKDRLGTTYCKETYEVLRKIKKLDLSINPETLTFFPNPSEPVSSEDDLSSDYHYYDNQQPQLNPEFYPLTSLAPLHGLTNLKSLDVFGNDIHNIDALSSLVNLKELDLGANYVTNLSSLKNLKKLTSLNIFDNQVVDINVLGGLSRLTYLDISNNPIVNVSALSSLTHLNYLIIEQTSIDKSSLENCPVHSENSLLNEFCAKK